MFFVRSLIACALLIVIAACGTEEQSTKVKPMQSKDKRLSCKEILLEMNEAEFYRKMAYKNKGPKMKNVIMPLGYISTYVDAEEAIDAAEARVSYLERIYEILDCAEKKNKSKHSDKEKLSSIDDSDYSAEEETAEADDYNDTKEYQVGSYHSPYEK